MSQGEAYTLEARIKFPHAKDDLTATLALAIMEASLACFMLEPIESPR